MIDMTAFFDKDFGTIADAIRLHARDEPGRLALICGDERMDYAGLDVAMDRVAATLQREGLRPGDAIAICASASIPYAAVFLGGLRAGVVVAPLAHGSTAASLAGMLADAEAHFFFIDSGVAAGLDDGLAAGIPRIALDGSDVGRSLDEWLVPPGTQPAAATPEPDWPFNIIYSSGTTGEPKGIVQGHGMRWAHVRRGANYAYGPRTVTLLSTPLYSNTTLTVFFPTLAWGGCVALMARFDALGYLALAEAHRVTHTMLVPVQYQRLMVQPRFGEFDLSAFQYKFSTSAPFGAVLKADVLKRWPGGLVEFYGMTEGGGTCILEAHLHPDKLHTVGRPAPGHDIRLIDDDGQEAAAGEAGEVVGHSPGMMIGYHHQPQKTREAEWFDAAGRRFIRTGDVGRFDAEGFLTLFDRKKDLVISGGFNVYPSDLEAVLMQRGEVVEAAVVGVPSEQWGETPVAFVVLVEGVSLDAGALKQWANDRLGKTQRLHDLRFIDELPRSAIGKVLKRELRLRYLDALPLPSPNRP